MQRIFPRMNIFTAFFGQKSIILFIALLAAPLNSETNPIQLNFHNWFSFFYFRARRAILLSYILHKTIQFNTYSIKPNFFSSFCLWFTFSPPHSVGACCALRDLPALLGLHTNSAGSLSFSLPFTPSGCVCVMQMKADTKRIGFHCFRCGFLFLWPDFLLLKFKTFRKSICCRANSLKFPSVSVRIACTYIIKIVDCNIGLIFRRDVAWPEIIM